jgi:hypothetical protein
MNFSEARISHLAHRIMDGLWRDDLVDYSDEGRVLQVLKTTISRLLAAEEEVDRLVRNKLQRQHQVPGTREWQVLYERYFREEMNKRRG